MPFGNFNGHMPFGNPIIRMHCYVCSAMRPEGIQCSIDNRLKLYRTEECCPTADNGDNYGECRHFSYDMDDCVHNGFVAMVYRFVNNITEDDRKFEPPQQ